MAQSCITPESFDRGKSAGFEVPAIVQSLLGLESLKDFGLVHCIKLSDNYV